METRFGPPNVAVLESDGKVSLPPGVIEDIHLVKGDLLFVSELSADSIVLKKIDPSKSAIDMLEELGAALRAAGYDTREKVDQLVDEVKLEVTEEWLAKIGLSRDGSS